MFLVLLSNGLDFGVIRLRSRSHRTDLMKMLPRTSPFGDDADYR